jgi:uncharacterized membrane protein
MKEIKAIVTNFSSLLLTLPRETTTTKCYKGPHLFVKETKTTLILSTSLSAKEKQKLKHHPLLFLPTRLTPSFFTINNNNI